MPPKKTTRRTRDPLDGRRIVVGVTGGIAAYKAAELVSTLRQRGAAVTVVMTDAAQQFVTPLTFESLSGNRVVTGMFSDRSPYVMGHIALCDWADALVIAPATANVIGKFAAGLADDALTTTVISAQAPILLAPAMNDQMYKNPVVQANLAHLRELGFAIVGPAKGWLACGRIGEGRMADVADILKALEAAVQ